MRAKRLSGGTFAYALILVLMLVGGFAGHLSLADAAVVTVTGRAQCSDCSRKSSNHDENTFKGLQVAIKCRATVGGNYEATAIGTLDSHGSIAVPLPASLFADNSLPNHDCIAELQTASTNRPCHNQAKPSKIVFNRDNKVGVSAMAGTIPFLSTVCASPVDTSLTFFHKPWLWHKYLSFFHPKPYYPQPYYKPAPQITPVPEFKPPTNPVYTKPTPTYKPPVGPSYKPSPIYMPAVGPVPTYKPPVGPVPTYTSPAVPYYKSAPVFYGHLHPWKLWKGKHHPFFPQVKH